MPTYKEGWKERFLERFEKVYNISKAARAAGISREWVRQQLNTDPDFAARFEEAREGHFDLIEEEGIKRARKKSDLLTIFFLKANRAETYNIPNREEVSGPEGGPLIIRWGDDRRTDDDSPPDTS